MVASPLNARARDLACLIGESIPETTANQLLVGVDSGDGIIANEHPDVCVTFVENSTEVRVHALGMDVRTSIAEAPHTVAEILQGFDEDKIAKAVLDDTPSAGAALPNNQLPIGWLADHMPKGRVELGVGLFEGVMSADIAELLGRMEVPVTITPWKGLILHDLSEGDADVVVRVLAPRGLIFDVNSPFFRTHLSAVASRLVDKMLPRHSTPERSRHKPHNKCEHSQRARDPHGDAVKRLRWFLRRANNSQLLVDLAVIVSATMSGVTDKGAGFMPSHRTNDKARTSSD